MSNPRENYKLGYKDGFEDAYNHQQSKIDRIKESVAINVECEAVHSFIISEIDRINNESEK